MKAQLITALIAISAMAAGPAFAQDPADVNLTKSSVNVDWNKMIEGNNVSKKTIQQNIDQSLAEIDADESSDKSRVLDFVDVEVGWGEHPTNNIVDRRFNSVGGAQPVDISTLTTPDNI